MSVREARVGRDPLTGLLDRTTVLEEVEATGGCPGTVVMFIDLDGFKEVNDVHGHRAGDRVLEAAGRRIASAVRSGDVVGRIGGDEILVVCKSERAPGPIEDVADRVVSSLARPIAVGGATVQVSASVGVAAAVDDTAGADDLVDLADQAMYRAKAEGGDRWKRAEPGWRRSARSGTRDTVEVAQAVLARAQRTVCALWAEALQGQEGEAGAALADVGTDLERARRRLVDHRPVGSPEVDIVAGSTLDLDEVDAELG